MILLSFGKLSLLEVEWVKKALEWKMGTFCIRTYFQGGYVRILSLVVFLGLPRLWAVGRPLFWAIWSRKAGSPSTHSARRISSSLASADSNSSRHWAWRIVASVDNSRMQG